MLLHLMPILSEHFKSFQESEVLSACPSSIVEVLFVFVAHLTVHSSGILLLSVLDGRA